MCKFGLMLPNIEFLEFGNIYSGSVDNFNFKVFPNNNKDKFEIVIWLGKYCLEHSEVVARAVFEMSDKGCQCAQSWLESQFDNFNKKENF